MAEGRAATTFSADELHDMAARGEGRSDLARVNAMSEAEPERSIAADPDWCGVPRDWFCGAEAVRSTGSCEKRQRVRSGAATSDDE